MDKGITPADSGLDGISWNVVGHTYVPKLHTPNALIWHATIPADTFVPPHIHSTQDEWVTMLEGEVTCVFGVAPARKLFDLFGALDGVTDPAELVRLSALHEVDFLPPPDEG